MAILFANNAYGTLAGSISAAATTIDLSTGQGARFPSPTSPDYFLATLIGIDGNGNENSWEIVKVTGRTNDALTVVRAQESTTGAIWAAGTRIELRVTKGSLDLFTQGVLGADVQAYDADLAAIAALAGTSGFLKKTGANAWTLDTSTYLTGNQSITLSGDASGSGTTSISVTLASSGVGAGTYRSVTVDTKGRVTAGTNPTTIAGYGITDAVSTSAANTFTANQTFQSNLIFNGTSRRITGDMSNATVANRLAFQTSTTNGNTTVSVIPHGTGNTTQIAGFTDSAMTNSTVGGVYIDTAEVRLFSSAIGSGSTTPITMRIGATEYMRLGTSGGYDIKTGLREAKVAMGANDVNLRDGNYFTKTFSAGSVTLTVSNTPASGTVASFILDLTNGGLATITWWSGMKWAGGTGPTLTSAGRDVLGFFTHDGGTTWTGLLLGKDVK